MVSLDIFRTPSGVLKSINLGLLVITIAVFYSRYSSWYQFVGTTTVSAFAYLIILLLTYIFGGMAIQKTLYELFMNIYFVIMFFVSTVLSLAYGHTGITVSTGVFCLFCFLIFAADIYFALKNAGALTPVTSNHSPQAPPPTSIPPPTININAGGAFPSSVSNPTATIQGPATINPSY